MSRGTDDGRHEGWVALLFADGERASGTSGRGVIVWPDDDIKREEIRPFADVIAWQPQCECGWRGVRRLLADERDENIDRKYNEPTEAREDELMAEWERHIAPEVRTARVSDLADRLADVQHDLSAAVAEARAAGASWGDLGRALGMTRQGAQQRYGG